MKGIYKCFITAALALCLAGCGSPREAEASIPGETEGNIGQEESKAEETRRSAAASSSERSDILQGEDNENVKEETMKISVKSSEYEIIYQLNDSQAAKDLYGQLPITVETEPFSNNEITFYPPEKLNTENTPLGSGEPGTLAYYKPWGDVVMFYAPCAPNNSLFQLGTAVSGGENVEKLTGSVTVSVLE